MQVGLTREELLSLIGKKADELSTAINARMCGAISYEISDEDIDKMVGRISALTRELFQEPPAVGLAKAS